jgi:hypothetical protein
MQGDVRIRSNCKFNNQLLTLFTSSLYYIASLLTAMILSSWFRATHVVWSP